MNKWTSHIDYVGFTVDVTDVNGETPDDITIKNNLFTSLAHLIGENESAKLLLCDGWESANGRKPYRKGYANKGCGVFVFYGGHPHATIEFSGKGCETMRDLEIMGSVLRGAADRMTRIDVACDLETETTPKKFVAEGYSDRIKSRNDRVSPTGETVTLGSWKSDRFCNVYRYSDPHPRSHLLRVEWRLKSHYAKNAALYLTAYTPAHLAAMCNNTYKFKSKEWQQMDVKETLPGKPDNKKSSSTLRWVLTQVAPAIQNLIREGVIEDPMEFFYENFMPEQKQNRMF